MATLWLSGAQRIPGPHAAGGAMAGGPPRMVHHITWDALDADGNPPPFDNVARYLVNAGYEPHLMIDPITGRTVQFLAFNRSGYALEHNGPPETNRMGTACIQVEWYFSPGVLRDGRRYATLADTPMAGLGPVLAVAAEYGIPTFWPAGLPAWQPKRDAAVWSSQRGHYGHGHVPNNTHTDPGPMRLTAPAPVNQEDDVTPADVAAITQSVHDSVVAILRAPEFKLRQPDQAKTAHDATNVAVRELMVPDGEANIRIQRIVAAELAPVVDRLTALEQKLGEAK